MDDAILVRKTFGSERRDPFYLVSGRTIALISPV